MPPDEGGGREVWRVPGSSSLSHEKGVVDLFESDIVRGRTSDVVYGWDSVSVLSGCGSVRAKGPAGPVCSNFFFRYHTFVHWESQYKASEVHVW